MIVYDMKDIEEILDGVIKDNQSIVSDWLVNKPSGWGALAGKAR